jgi:hypothetical protein
MSEFIIHIDKKPILIPIKKVNRFFEGGDRESPIHHPLFTII